MIIVSWPATGKSYYKGYQNILDLEGSPFKYLSPKSKSKTLTEKGPVSSEWPANYFNYLKKVKNNYDAVLAPSVQHDIIELLLKENIEFTVVLPDKSLKDEYIRRCVDRGDNTEWQKYFMDTWDERHSYLTSLKARTIVLEAGEYLEHAFKRLD